MAVRTEPRAIAIALIEHPVTGSLFVCETRWSHRPWFHRPAGGGIEMGERGEQALVREFREEFEADIEVFERVAVLENIFTERGEVGHEIVLTYRAAFRDEAFLDESGEWPVLDSEVDYGLWRPADLPLEQRMLYPDGLPELLGLPSPRA